MSKRETKALRGPTPRHKEGDEVVYIDNDSAPRLIFSGEDILCEDLPVGTRVVYGKPPIEGLNNPGAAIRYALNHPLDADPLYAQLRAGHARDHRHRRHQPAPAAHAHARTSGRRIIEILLELLDANGVDDIHLVIANSLHRRMTEAEMKRMVGKKIFDAFHPDRYYNHDAEDPDGMTFTWARPPRARRSTSTGAPSRAISVIYVNINLVPMDGGHKSVAVGLCGYESVRVHHDPDTMRPATATWIRRAPR